MNKTAKESQALLFSNWQGHQREPEVGDRYTRDQASIHFDHAEDLYADWPPPTCIISDGPYGVSGFPGDNHKADSLAEWYEPHIKAWTKYSTPETTLWFWGTEVGWATVHPMLVAMGWEYRCCNIWDKGLGHVAGNANTQTLRKFPVVTEVCVHYVKAAMFHVGDGSLTMQEWLRHEWTRTGLPFRIANEACGVLNAATRKYLTADHLWYYPPVDAFAKLAEYANAHGAPAGRPYFSIDGKGSISGSQWAKMRAKFSCDVGVTNVWREPQVSGSERIQGTRNGMRYKFSGDPAKRVQVEQIGIARDDARGLAGHGEVQELVVSHVAARKDRGGCVRRHGVLDEPLEKNRAFVSSQVAIELGALQHPRKLRQGAIGPEQDPASPGLGDGLTGHGAVEQQETDEDIRIDDVALRRRHRGGRSVSLGSVLSTGRVCSGAWPAPAR